MKHLLVSGCLLFCCFAFGCKMRPVYEIQHAKINTMNAKAPSTKSVGDAIVKAGQHRGWDIKIQKPGYAIGKLNHRGHQIAVDIKYDSKEYSITYKDSGPTMKYDKDMNKIHKAYNNWVEYLEHDINRELAAL